MSRGTHKPITQQQTAFEDATCTSRNVVRYFADQAVEPLHPVNGLFCAHLGFDANAHFSVDPACVQCLIRRFESVLRRVHSREQIL